MTFFLGAGASKPLGKLLMCEFIAKLEDDFRFKESALFSQIVERDRDLEFVFEELDEWISKDYYAPFERLQKGGLYGILGASGYDQELKTFQAKFQQLLSEAYTLRSNLKREVFNAYRAVNNPKRALSLFQPIFDCVASWNGGGLTPQVVFTTNYDPSIEGFCECCAPTYRLHDGFFHDESSARYVWRRSQFDEFRPSNGKKDIVLFKLHGSTNWTKTSRGITKSEAAVYVDDDSIHENVLIYPAKRKVAIEDPFFTGYEYFHRCMENCLVCIVIGYSFRDYDALTKLMSAARYNPKLKLVVLDPNANAICNMLRGRNIQADPVPFKFGDQGPESDYILLIKSMLAISE